MVDALKSRQVITTLAAGVLLLVFASLASACGGDGATGSDEDYVAAVCKAQGDFQVALEKLSKDTSITTEAQAAKALIPAVEQLSKDFKAAKPPADAKDYHKKVASALDQAVKVLKDEGSLQAIDALDPGGPPADVGGRLQALADTNQDCTMAGFRFDE